MSVIPDAFLQAIESAVQRALVADVPEGKRLTAHLAEAIAPVAWNEAIKAAIDLINRQQHEQSWRFANILRMLLKPERQG